MAKGYTWDVFLSYRRAAPTEDWVRNHFYPLLEQWLPSFMPVKRKTVNIFIDKAGIKTGATWSVVLREALKTSRCLVPVWSTEYFRSEWCLAEWRSMLKREQKLRITAGKGHYGIIYPVIYVSNVNEFPPEARRRQGRNMERWNSPHPSFRDTREYNDFDREIQQLCKELAQMIARAPAWQSNFPVVTPKAPAGKVVVTLPRFRRP